MSLLMSRLVRGVAVALVVLSLGCSDPYKQTVEPPDSREYPSFVAAMKKLPLEEKNLVNAYVARMEEEGVRPVGVTLREAIDQQRKHEAEMASLSSKIIDGAVRVAKALGPKPTIVQPVVPPVATAPTAAPPPPATAPPVATAPTATVTTPAPTAPPVAPAPVIPPTPGTAAITGLELSSLLQEIDSRTFPHDRVALIRERAATRRFTTRQAIALAQTVQFPSMQVEILSALYPRVVDQESFDEVYKIFVFTEDRDALKARIDAMRGR